MPTTSTRPDYKNSPASDACEIVQLEENSVRRIEADEETLAKLLHNEVAVEADADADAEAHARAEKLMPRNEALKKLAKRFPAPQEWWDED